MKRTSKYPLAIQLVPIIFSDHGPACHLQLGGPVAEAIVGRAPVGSASTSNLSFPAIMTRSFGQVEMNHDSHAEALFEVWKTPTSTGGNVETCILKTATRLSISGFALPKGQQKVFDRVLPDVCFESGGASPRVNTELIWLKK
jgi:hypothetical protein